MLTFLFLQEFEKSLRRQTAIRDGFSRAFITIFDANVALILYVIGTGPVKGFAITLSIGPIYLGLDFSGGTLVEVTYEEPVELECIRKTLTDNGLKILKLLILVLI